MMVAVGMGLLVLPLLYAGLMVWLRAGWAENAAALKGQSGIRNPESSIHWAFRRCRPWSDQGTGWKTRGDLSCDDDSPISLRGGCHGRRAELVGKMPTLLEGA